MLNEADALQQQVNLLKIRIHDLENPLKEAIYLKAREVIRVCCGNYDSRDRIQALDMLAAAVTTYDDSVQPELEPQD